MEEEEKCLAASLRFTGKCVHKLGEESALKVGEILFFLVLMMVTFSHLINSKGLVEGNKGVLSENIERFFKRAGSKKEGEFLGLP